eukprot:gene2431-2919_t
MKNIAEIVSPIKKSISDATAEMNAMRQDLVATETGLLAAIKETSSSFSSTLSFLTESCRESQEITTSLSARMKDSESVVEDLRNRLMGIADDVMRLREDLLRVRTVDCANIEALVNENFQSTASATACVKQELTDLIGEQQWKAAEAQASLQGVVSDLLQAVDVNRYDIRNAQADAKQCHDDLMAVTDRLSELEDLQSKSTARLQTSVASKVSYEDMDNHRADVEALRQMILHSQDTVDKMIMEQTESLREYIPRSQGELMELRREQTAFEAQMRSALLESLTPLNESMTCFQTELSNMIHHQTSLDSGVRTLKTDVIAPLQSAQGKLANEVRDCNRNVEQVEGRVDRVVREAVATSLAEVTAKTRAQIKEIKRDVDRIE